MTDKPHPSDIIRQCNERMTRDDQFMQFVHSLTPKGYKHKPWPKRETEETETKWVADGDKAMEWGR